MIVTGTSVWFDIVVRIVNIVNIVVNIVLGTLRMGWYSQGHKFGLIDGNR